MRARRPVIFLNYAREDEITVRRIYEKFTAAGLHPWMDVTDIQPGEEWRAAIDSAIDRAGFFLAFISPRSIQKAGVLRQEIESARKRRNDLKSPLKVIPVRLEPCETPAEISDLQWIDLFDPDGWERLLKALGQPRSSLTGYAIGAVAVVLIAAVAYFALHRNSSDAIGATFWRLEPSRTGDPVAARSIFHPPATTNAQPVEYTPARVGAGTHLKSGDLFYVSIQSGRPGYVYIIDREHYTNGGSGAPELIFPTQRTRGGDNYLAGNALMRLPNINDNPPWFEVQSAAPGYTGEIFTVIVLPRPIPGFIPPPDHIELSASDFSAWQRNWQREAQLISSDPRSTIISDVEAVAHRSPQPVVLSANDPSQATLYRVPAGSDGAFWANFTLPVEK